MLIIEIEESFNGKYLNYDIFDSEEDFENGDGVDGGIHTNLDMRGAIQSACDMAQNLLIDNNTF